MGNGISDFIAQCLTDKAFSGAVYAYGNSADVIEMQRMGNLSSDGPNINLDSIFDLASLTKPISALPFMFLLEKGDVCLDDTIDHFLGKYKNSEKAKLTLRQLLSHSSGIPGQQKLYQHCETPEEMRKAVKELPLSFAPGTAVEYSSQGFMILGDILENIIGSSLDSILKEMIFTPLKMRSIGYNPKSSLKDQVAATEFCQWRNKIIQGEVHDENAVILDGVASHAGLFSPIQDLIILCQELLKSENEANNTFFTKHTAELMRKNHTRQLNLARGLGWQGKDETDSPAGDFFSPLSYGHTGFTGTSMWLDPVHDVFAVLLTNRVHPTRENPSITRIRRVFHNMVFLNTASHT
ncbi:serine hydrolase domain-containing protein [Salibacterium aidingense]|uniref:serine hydrolase domain-containing protein n=1 Tax=Salibacterium aidingense TaxID=384933 RepID=UPI003BD9D0D0